MSATVTPVGPIQRRRYAAVGAVVAVLVGGGGLLTASAADSPNVSSFVPIKPCRLLDTRAASVVGHRATPIGAQETLTATAWGLNGNCTIPAGATGLSMDVVAVNGTAPSFLTVFPSDQPQPLASSLNWVGGQQPTPNAVTVQLSADGRVSFYNNGGTVDIAVDIVGYYTPSNAGPQGPQGDKGDPGDPGPRPSQVVWVAKSGGDFASVASALNAIGTTLPAGDSTHRYVIKIAPGTYTEAGGVALKNFVDLEGSGQDNTIITCSCGGPGTPFTDASSATMRIQGPAMTTEVRNLTVSNTGPGVYSTGVWNGGGTPFGSVSLQNITITASGGTGNYALVNLASNLSVARSTITAVGANSSTEVFSVANLASSGVVLRDVAAYANGTAGNRIALYNNDSSAEVHESFLIGTNSSINNSGVAAIAYVADTELSAAVTGSPGSFHCTGAYDGLFVAKGVNC